MAELKKCPFCGGDVNIIYSFDSIQDMECWQVWCNSCDLTMTEDFDTGTKENIITKWNTRVSDE